MKHVFIIFIIAAAASLLPGCYPHTPPAAASEAASRLPVIYAVAPAREVPGRPAGHSSVATSVVSPDGTRRVEVREDEAGNLDLYLMNADGTGVQRLTYDEAWDVAPQWSADGRSLHYLSSRGGRFAYYTIELDSGAAVAAVLSRRAARE